MSLIRLQIKISLALILTALLHQSGVAEAPANADSKVKYVGTEACIECHKDQHKTYLDTTHSRSTERVDPANEPASSSFLHDLSGHTYEVTRANGKLVHREILRDVDGKKLAVCEEPIAFTIGSGTHGKSYVYKRGNFYGQSPLSWFKESKSWDMSPGYDVPYHAGFRRSISMSCFFCHVGSIDRKQGNPHDFLVMEEKIGCERCHGPGELHVAKYRANPKLTGDDDTIVNPAKLPRKLSEHICAQCHLQAASKAQVTGKDEWDYRPGLPLTDFRVDYQYRLGDDTMKVVGHHEQLRMSKCYQETESLTCVTCHNPHAFAKPEEAVEHYRSICLSCHNDQDCGKPHNQRVAEAENNCATCHMPKQKTRVPHTAFRHHRIGIHTDEAREQLGVIAGLSPVLDISQLSESERARCEALAKVQITHSDPGNENFRDYGIESAKTLIQLKNAGNNDADLNTILAFLAFEQRQVPIAKNLAEEVLKIEPRPTSARIESVQLLARLSFARRDFKRALELYRELATYRRDSEDAYYLGMAEQNTGNTPQAIDAFKLSVEIDPTQLNAHRALAAVLASIGRQEEARVHSEAVRKNEALMKKLIEKSKTAAKE